VAEVSFDILHSSIQGPPFPASPNPMTPNKRAWLLMATTSLTTYGWFAGCHCPGAPFVGTLVLNLAWWMIFNTAVNLLFYRKARDRWTMSLAWLNVFT